MIKFVSSAESQSLSSISGTDNVRWWREVKGRLRWMWSQFSRGGEKVGGRRWEEETKRKCLVDSFVIQIYYQFQLAALLASVTSQLGWLMLNWYFCNWHAPSAAPSTFAARNATEISTVGKRWFQCFLRIFGTQAINLLLLPLTVQLLCPFRVLLAITGLPPNTHMGHGLSRI